MSNIDIIRNVTAELATRTKAQVTGWRWADGVVVFPDIRCPYCKQGVRSSAIWKHNDTHLIGQVVPQMGVTPALAPPTHAHVVDPAGGICFGRAKTAYQALFGALNGTPEYRFMVAPFLDSPLMGNHHCAEMDAIAAEGMFTCYSCEDEFDRDDACHFDDETYCNACFNEVAFSCWNCGDTYSNNDRETGSDDYDYCYDCWNARFFKCEECNTVDRQESSYDTPNGAYCETCYSDNYFDCESCGETTANGDEADYADERLCQTCFDDNFTKCEDCDEVYKNDYGHECTEANDYDEDTLYDAEELVRLAIANLPKGTTKAKRKFLERVRAHIYQRYLKQL
jgi:hypothetical protein